MSGTVTNERVSARARLLAWVRPSVATRAERFAHWVAVFACVFFSAVAFWESFGPSRSGHLATGAGYAIAGENMALWHKFGVYAGYLTHAPTPDQYYCHHPYGITILEAIAFEIFGHHWFTLRAPAIFCAVISTPLVYGFGKRAWGVIPAAVAACFFAFVPIDLAFSNFSNLEEPTIAFGLLFAWATARLWESSQTRYLVLSAIGALGCCQGDWVGLVFIGTVGVFGFFRAYVVPRAWVGRIDDRMHARWFAYATVMAVGTLVLYLALFGKADKLGDLIGSYELRSSGQEATITETFSQRRKLWLGVMFTPIAYGALAAGIPLAILRLVRKPLEIFPIAWFLAASFQYFLFKQGADIHIFWPHYYAPAAAFAAGTTTATLLRGREALVGFATRHARRPELVARVTGALLAIVVVVPVLLLARMGIPELVQSRKTAGRFDSGGKYIGTDGDMADFAKWSVSTLPKVGTTLQALEKYDFNFSSEYAIDRPYVRVQSLTPAKAEDSQRFAVVDTRNQPLQDLAAIATRYGVEAVGPLWKVDRSVKGPQLRAIAYTEREPNAFEWLFVSGTDVVRSISHDEDPYATWELADALNLPTTHPVKPPVTLEELRVAHNIAVSEKDAARAEALRAQLAPHSGVPSKLVYSGGVHLLGVDVQPGPAIVVTLYWQTEASFKKVDASFDIKCKIVKPPPLWFTNTDYFEKEMAPVPIIRPGMWKPGYLYRQRFTALHRIGREDCRGTWSSSEFRQISDAPTVLFTLE